MAKLINPKTGEAIETEDKHVQAWLKEGFEPAVLMKDTSGTQAYVPASQAKPLLDAKQAIPIGERQVEKISKTESFLRGSGQGVTLGLLDEGIGAYEAVRDGLFGDKTMKEAYVKGRDESRANNEAAKAANPGAYGTGTVVGAIAPTVIAALGTGGTAAPVTMATAMRAAAAGGGLNAFGTSKADNAKDLAVDTLEGAALGAATGGLLKGAANVVGGGAKVSAALDNYAKTNNTSAERGLRNIVSGTAGNVKNLLKGDALERHAGAEAVGTLIGMPGVATVGKVALGPTIKNVKEFAGPAATITSPFRKIDSVLDSARKAGDLRQGTSNAVANYNLQQTDRSYRDAVNDENELYGDK